MKRELDEIVAGIHLVEDSRSGGKGVFHYEAYRIPTGVKVRVNPFNYEAFEGISFMDKPMYALIKHKKK